MSYFHEVMVGLILDESTFSRSARRRARLAALRRKVIGKYIMGPIKFCLTRLKSMEKKTIKE